MDNWLPILIYSQFQNNEPWTSFIRPCNEQTFVYGGFENTLLCRHFNSTLETRWRSGPRPCYFTEILKPTIEKRQH